MELFSRLMERWVEEAAQLRERYALESAARVCEAHARELSDAIREVGEELLTVSEAAEESGYSKQHIRSLIASGDVPNAGCKGRPRVRRADLPPRKARRTAAKGRTRMPKTGQRRGAKAFDARRIVRG
jgi:ribosomal protein L19E